MSQENVETVKEFTRVLEAGDPDAGRDYFDPDVVYRSQPCKPAAVCGGFGRSRLPPERDWTGQRRYPISASRGPMTAACAQAAHAAAGLHCWLR
jgi:hypothetical protein